MRAQEMTTFALELLADPQGDYFEQPTMLRFLNRALRDISNRSRSISLIEHHEIMEGQYRYPLPPDFLKLELVWCKWNSGYPLVRAQLVDVEVGASYISGNPEIYDIWGRATIEKAREVPVESSDRNARTITVNQSLVSVKHGDTVINLSDKHAGATVETVSLAGGKTVITVDRFVLGTNNYPKTNDLLRIIAPSLPDHSIGIAPKPSRCDELGDESLAIYSTKSHYEVTQALIDAQNDELEIDAELEMAVLYRMLYFARTMEQGEDAKAPLTNLQLSEQEFSQNISRVRRRSQQKLNAFKSTLNTTQRPRITGYPRYQNPLSIRIP